MFFRSARLSAASAAGVFSFLNNVLDFYSNVAIAWIGAICADLVINKPLGLSPSFTEFKLASSSSGLTCTTSTRSGSARC